MAKNMQKRMPIIPPFEMAQQGDKGFGTAQAWAAGGNWEFEVPLDALLAGFYLDFAGTITIGNAPVGYVALDLNVANFACRTINLDIGALGTKKRMSGFDAYVMGSLRRTSALPIDPLTTAEANAAAAYAVSVRIPVDCATFGMAPQDFGLLNAKGHHSVTLRGTFGTVNDVLQAGVGAGGTFAAVGNLTATRRMVLARQYDPRGYGNLVETPIDATIAASRDYEFDLTPFRRHRSVFINTRAGTTGALSDAVVTNVQLRVESSVFPLDLSWVECLNRTGDLHRPDTFGNVAFPTAGIAYLEWGKVLRNLPATYDASLDAGEASQVTLILSCVTAAPNPTVRVLQSYYEL